MPASPYVDTTSGAYQADTSIGGLRILSIAPTSFFSDYGCHVRILEEARALKTLGHRVTILTYYKGANVPGFEIIRTAPTPWHRDYEVGSSRHKYVFDLLLAIRLLRVLARNRYDVIHAHLHEGALIGSILSRPWNIPVCFDYQGSLTSEMLDHGFLRSDTRMLGFWQRLEQFIERQPDAIFTSTLNAREALRSHLGPGASLTHLPDGVNTDVFHPAIITPDERASHRAKYGISPDDTLVVYLGLLARHQGISCLIESAARLKQLGQRVRWLVMGYPGASHWRRLAEAAGVAAEMFFTDRIPYVHAPEWLAMGDIAVAPKLSQTEGSGKILNYMAMGLPTVAFATAAQQEILGDLGIYAPVGDVAGLSDRILELAQQPEKRTQLGLQLRERAQAHFSWSSTALAIDQVYRQLLARTKPEHAKPVN